MDVLEYKKKSNFQNWDWNKTSVDKVKELRQVALMAFKSQDNMTEMPGKESGEDAFKKWTAKFHRALKLIVWEICSTAYTMFKMEHPDHGNGVRDFKWKWWHDSDAKRDQDAKGKSAAKQDAEVDGEESPAKNPRKAKKRIKIRRQRPRKKKPEKALVVSRITRESKMSSYNRE